MAELSQQALRARFDTLADEWAEATRFQSSSTEIAIHPAYQQIIGMGPAVLPLIRGRGIRRGVGHLRPPYQMTSSATSRSYSSVLSPRSPVQTSSLCCPKSGAGP